MAHIAKIFDGLSYSKAASGETGLVLLYWFILTRINVVLRMLSNYVGEDRFRKGVSIYLKNKLYENSVKSDLWEGISQAAGIDVSKVMDDWIKKVAKSVHPSPTADEYAIEWFPCTDRD